MTDLDEFIAFFASKGIGASPYRCPEEEGQDVHPLGWKDEAQWVGPRIMLSVSQCHFVFSPDGRFVGTHADDMGYFLPRGV